MLDELFSAIRSGDLDAVKRLIDADRLDAIAKQSSTGPRGGSDPR